MNKIQIIPVILSVCLLTACIEPRYLEKQGLITAAGYDVLEGNKLFGTIVLLIFNPTVPHLSIVLEDEVNTSKGIKGKLTMDTSHSIVSGQLRTAVFGRELAEKGLSSVVDSLNRDATIGNMVYLFVSETTANDILHYNELIKKSNDLGTYLYNLNRHNIETEVIISNTLHEFMHDFLDVGNDPILPMVKLDNTRLGISGIALFNDDKLVGTMPIDRMFYLKVLMDRFSAGGVELNLSKEEYENISNKEMAGKLNEEQVFLVLDCIKSDKKISIKDKKNLTFKIDVDIIFRLLEISEPLDFSKSEVVHKVEAEVNKKIKEKTEETLKELQEIGSDPVNFSGVYSARIRKELTEEKWRELYKDAKFEINVKSTLKSSGVTN